MAAFVLVAFLQLHMPMVSGAFIPIAHFPSPTDSQLLAEDEALIVEDGPFVSSQEVDVFSLMSLSTELSRSVPPVSEKSSQVEKVMPPFISLDPEAYLGSSWEERFKAGDAGSRYFTDTEDKEHTWTRDPMSGGGVPLEMKHAETLLLAAEDAPAGNLWKAKAAARSLRMYHHARWLAERGHVLPAEFRFVEAAELARRARRSVLASHALGRLGYFLLQWRRTAEAKVALEEASRLNSKTNPLATYLHAVLLRQDVGPDIAALLAAEESILTVGTQPSEELEMERIQHVEDINFWRLAESNPHHCLTARTVAHGLICAFGHAGFAFRQAVIGLSSGELQPPNKPVSLTLPTSP